MTTYRLIVGYFLKVLSDVIDYPVGTVQEVEESIFGEDAALEVRGQKAGLIRLEILLPLARGHVVAEDGEIPLVIEEGLDGHIQFAQDRRQSIITLLHLLYPGDERVRGIFGSHTFRGLVPWPHRPDA